MKEFELTCPIGKELSEDKIFETAASACGTKVANIANVEIVKRSIDARSNNIVYRYRLAAYLKNDLPKETLDFPYKNVSNSEPIIIIGAGPAGLFCALTALQLGYKPIILERGKDIHKRKYDVASLSTQGIVNSDSNYCFGEGGAGTFSDGKLYTRSSKRGNIQEVLHQLVAFGADPSITYEAHPHIGSDQLPRIMENIRFCIEEHGGEYHFETRVKNIEKLSDSSWKINGEFSAKNIVLATGHSARDIYELFAKNNWEIEAKGFALGVRVEHPQMLINQIQYHKKYQPFFPAAEYSLVSQIENRGVFSFCMCPGGILVPASTSENELVLNGMSNSQRNSKWANAGIVVSIEPNDILADYKGSNPNLAVLEFQKSVERRAFEFSSSLKAPAQRMTDFCANTLSSSLPKSSYHPGCVSAPLADILPQMVSQRLKQAFRIFDKKMRGYFTSEALMLGVESRTSSPIRIPRDSNTFQHPSLPGIYPCGEGAGYAGGIVSSALDGINCAKAIFANAKV